MGSAPFMFRYPFMYGAEPYMNRQFPRSGTNTYPIPPLVLMIEEDAEDG